MSYNHIDRTKAVCYQDYKGGFDMGLFSKMKQMLQKDRLCDSGKNTNRLNMMVGIHSKRCTQEGVKRCKAKEVLIVLVCMIALLTSCTASKIEKIEINANEVTMDVNAESSHALKLSPENIKDVTIEIEADQEIDVSIVNGKELIIKSQDIEGNFYITLQDGETKSNKVNVQVVDKAKKAAQEKERQEAEAKAKLEAEETARREAEIQAQQEAEAAAIAQQEAAQQQASQTQSVQQSAPQSDQVYIAGSGNGTKYHRNPNCSNMKSVIALSVENAQAQGFGACKKCY